MTFTEISKAVYRRVKLADTPSAADIARVQQFINLWYREILSEPGMDRLRDTTLTFTTVANQAQYGLPSALVKIRDLYDVSNQRKIEPITLDWLRRADPGLTASSATVEFWLPLNGWGAVKQPLTSTGVGLWAVSDSASDTVPKVYVETMRLGGVRAGTAVSGGTTITGLTRVALGSKTDHIDVIKFYLDAAPVGNISLYDAATNGNLLATITAGRTNARYFMIQLYPTPAAAVVISVDCQRAIEDMVQANEEPLLPEDFHHGLVHGAAFEEWTNRSDDRSKLEYSRAVKVFANMRHQVLNDPDQILVQRGPRGAPETPSRLGGWYPGD